MSNRNNSQFKSSANLIFNKKINLFPDDFFSSFDKANECDSQNKNKFHPILPFKENKKTNSFNNCRNIDKNKKEDNNINNYTNVIKLDNIMNTDFSFQGPPSPPSSSQRNKINNKKHSFSAINKTNSLKPLYQSPLSQKKTNYELNKSNRNSKRNFKVNFSEKRVNSYNNNNCNDLFKETKFKFLNRKNISNIKLSKNYMNSKKEKEIEVEKNLEKNFKRNINNNILKIKKNEMHTDKDMNKDQEKEKEKEKEKSFNITSKRNRTNTNFYRPYTPLIKNKKMKKLVNIHKSREILLKSSSSKPIKDKNPILDTEKKIKNKSKLIPHMNNFNKRAISLNNNKKNKGSNNINNDNSLNFNNKSNMQKKIRISINNLFKNLPKNCEDNPVIFNKFESLIKNMKNIQEIILKKKLSLYNNNNINHDNDKNLEGEKNPNNFNYKY